MQTTRTVAGLLVAGAILGAAGVAAAAEGGGARQPAKLLAALPDSCNTPDGMALQPDNSIIVSMPNFNDEKSGPRLMRVTPDNKVEEFHVFPNPYPGLEAPLNRIRPMGMARAANGDLFVADMQYMVDPNQKSRLWRLVVRDGKVERMVLVAKGMNVANGIAIRGESLYITESALVPGSDPLVSAVLRFRLSEENVTLRTPLGDDPHVLTVLTATTPNTRKWAFGADGIAFDSKGNLFVGQFGDGVVYRIELGAAGEVLANKVFAQAPGQMINCDGMSCDLRTDKLYIADSANNAIQIVNPDGTVETLAVNGEVTDKASGQLVQPCEVLVRGDTVVVSNMDWPFPGFKNEKLGHQQPATLSVIALAKPGR